SGFASPAALLESRFEHPSGRMLKTATSFVLGSSKSSTYRCGYASVAVLPAAWLENRFEHPRAD
ncbi:MAG TPA: hypothetical protein PKK30_16260, partial [Nitrospira sp.]|nr:hypothetical protein [Nitrospira sp.]